MTDTKMVSERDAVLRERKAWRAGVIAFHLHEIVPSGPEASRAREEIAAQASDEYPLPTVTRPRVVPSHNDTGTRYFRISDGQLQTRCAGLDTWHCLAHGSAHAVDNPAGLALSLERVALLADLLAHPTETVEDDA